MKAQDPSMMDLASMGGMEGMEGMDGMEDMMVRDLDSSLILSHKYFFLLHHTFDNLSRSGTALKPISVARMCPQQHGHRRQVECATLLSLSLSLLLLLTRRGWCSFVLDL